MTADICASRGWSVDFLGHNVPDPSLVEMVERRRPQVLALSVTMASGLEHLASLAQLLIEAAPNVRMVVGGQALDAQSTVAMKSNSRWEIAKDVVSDPTEHLKISPGEHGGQHGLHQRFPRFAVTADMQHAFLHRQLFQRLGREIGQQAA